MKEVLKDPSGLQVRVYYLECLAHASYIVEHDGKAVVIDPRRDVDAYIDVRKQLTSRCVCPKIMIPYRVKLSTVWVCLHAVGYKILK